MTFRLHCRVASADFLDGFLIVSDDLQTLDYYTQMASVPPKSFPSNPKGKRDNVHILTGDTLLLEKYRKVH